MTESAAEKPANRWTKVVVWGGVFVILAFLGWGLLKRGESRPTVDSEAPDFTLQLFDGYYDEFDDGSMTLSDLEGRVVVVNFWASWCVECRVEADELEALWALLAPSGRLLYVTCSVLAAENDAIIGDFLARHGNAQEDRVLPNYNIRDLMVEKTCGFQVLPGSDELDGFYYACLERTS